MTLKFKILKLDFLKAVEYFKLQLNDGNTIAKELLKLDFSKGEFFCLLRQDANEDRIYEFKSSGILPENSLEPVEFQGKMLMGRKKSDSICQLAQYLYESVHANECCIFEDIIHTRLEVLNSELKSYIICHNHEVYLKLTKDQLNPTLIEKMINYTDAQWYYMNFITEKIEQSKLNDETVKSLASKTRCITVGAYDMEGFILWKATPHTFMTAQ